MTDIFFNMQFYWRWILLPMFFVVVYIAWEQHQYLFELLPFDNKLPVYPLVQISLYALFAIIGFVVLWVVVSVIRKPIFEEMGINRRLRQNGFKNSEGEYPIFISKRRDKTKRRGFIYTFKNRGISLVSFDKRKHQLDTVLKGRVGNMYYGRSTATTCIHVIPHKYDTPNIISATQDYLIHELINLLCVGRTGSGKSYALAVILGALARFNPDISITICDYKKSSFSQYEDTPNFYGYNDVPDGIRAFHKEFKERLEANDPERNNHKRVLLIDEYGALIMAQEKKQGDELRTIVADMLFMGRSLGMILIVGLQRAEAEHFKVGCRDQFKAVLSMGNLSSEQKQMLYKDYKDELVAKNRVGEGYLLIDGEGVSRVKVAAVNNPATLDEIIRPAMYR